MKLSFVNTRVWNESTLPVVFADVTKSDWVEPLVDSFRLCTKESVGYSALLSTMGRGQHKSGSWGDTLPDKLVSLIVIPSCQLCQHSV